ncbi:MAG: hypothetical protein LBQ38_00490 [Spirochaetaceae bacterium]|jgi:hypothetical protein|nr:hypothetical protein [Spirochaetaceae bacterium]
MLLRKNHQTPVSPGRGFGLVLAVVLAAALVFTGCQTDAEDEPPVKEPKTWTAAANTAAGNFTGLAYGKDVFVAVTNAQEIFWSADGETWQTATAGYADLMSTTNQYVYFLNDQFVLVDRGGAGGNWAKSTDGKTWTKIAGAPAARAAGGGAFGNETYVIGSNGSTVYTSVDLAAWTAKEATGVSRTSGETTVPINWINSLAYGKGQYVIGGGGGLIAHSGDLDAWEIISWAKSADLFGTGNNDYVNQIVFSADKGLFMAVGGPSGGQAIAVSSQDGITWDQTGDIQIGTNDNRIYLGYGAGVFLTAFGSLASYTTDAYTWTPVTDTKFGTNAINAIAYGAGRFVMVGGGGTIAYSIPE